MSTRIDSLTGIRAVAALIVCLTHAAFWTGGYTDDYVGRLFSRFEIGVAIFFVLSGFLLFRPWVRAAVDDSTPPSVQTYAWHRARRILPAYWLTVLAVYALFTVYAPPDAAPTGTGWSGLVRNLTLTQVYGVGHLHSGLTQMWSLAAEVVFYLLLPVIAWVLIRVVCGGRWRPDVLIVGLLAVMCISPIWALAVVGNTGADLTARLWAPAFLWWFVAGMVLAVVARLIRRWPATPSFAVAVAAFALSATGIAGEPTITPTTASATIVKHLLYLVIAVGLIGPLIVSDQSSWWARLCGSRPMVWLGEISYEFFLVHVVVLEVAVDVLGYGVFQGSMIVTFVVTTVASVPIAWVLHRATAPLWRIRRPGHVVAGR
ncbi:acyltransferase family protein [Gordonia soli]|uniref:Acyltransferase 3 domain-containing protein n=1 Tax=Gordonia soli NBRC 108243 TaxID=1223545 RepID=M0QJU3_9ACTN|nr:acyltransferase [Gordonia soli]GAC67712.1 hypothetical protein GS4_09_00260 [Gordonia soli NBRC 108243]